MLSALLLGLAATAMAAPVRVSLNKAKISPQNLQGNSRPYLTGLHGDLVPLNNFMDAQVRGAILVKFDSTIF